MKISIVIPVFNEERYIIEVLNRVNLQKKYYDLEIIVSDDSSSDGTLNLLKKNRHLYDILVENSQNLGKGHAIINCIDKIKGDYVLIQDADLEYDPNDYKDLFFLLKI